MKKICVILLLVLLMTTNVFASGFNVWKAIEEANTYEQNNEQSKALPIWLEIIEYFNGLEKNESTYTNLAIFTKKVGKYYDSIGSYQNAVKYYELENDYWNKVGKSWGAEDMIRADEIRTIFEYYAEVKATQTTFEKYEPLSGLYTGIYSENDYAIGQNFYKTKSVLGPHAQYILYQNWGKMITPTNYIDMNLAYRMKAENASFHLALNPMNGLDAVSEDNWILNWAKQAKQLDMPIFLRFACEMNGDWVNWHGDPDLYIEKFRLVHDIMAEHAPNVAMVWTPNDGPIQLNGHRIEDYYPGDDYVDWVGVNFYVDYYDSGNIANGDNHLQNPLSHLDYIYNLYADRKPIMISETGTSHYSIPNSKDVTDWGVENLKKLYTSLPIKYPKVKAINYFSLNQANANYVVGNRWNNYAITENPLFKSTYKELIQSKYYLDSMSDSVDTTFVQLDKEEISKHDEIYFFIKIPDYKINKVEFYEDGKLLSTDKELPYSYKGDLKSKNNFVVKVYDSKGKLAYTETLIDKSFKAEAQVIPQGDLEVSVANFSINLRGTNMNPVMSQYPLLVYNQITYFPMTYNATQGLGIDAKWSSSDNHLKISQVEPNGNIEEYIQATANPSVLGASQATFKITVNGKLVDNSKEEHPILIYNNITYFPLTWKWANDEFGWHINYTNENGLTIK